MLTASQATAIAAEVQRSRGKMMVLAFNKMVEITNRLIGNCANLGQFRVSFLNSHWTNVIRDMDKHIFTNEEKDKIARDFVNYYEALGYKVYINDNMSFLIKWGD